MVTTRSKYTFKQFRKVFEKLAHEKAIEAVAKLESGNLLIKAYHPWGTKYVKGALSEVNTGKHHFKFYAKHLSYSFYPTGKSDNSEDYNHPDCISFDIEEKFYGSTAHCSKISFYTPEIENEDEEVEDEWGFKEHPVDHEKTNAEKEKRKKKIDDFLANMMKESGIKIEPRLSLKDCKK